MSILDGIVDIIAVGHRGADRDLAVVALDLGEEIKFVFFAPDKTFSVRSFYV